MQARLVKGVRQRKGMDAEAAFRLDEPDEQQAGLAVTR